MRKDTLLALWLCLPLFGSAAVASAGADEDSFAATCFSARIAVWSLPPRPPEAFSIAASPLPVPLPTDVGCEGE